MKSASSQGHGRGRLYKDGAGDWCAEWRTAAGERHRCRLATDRRVAEQMVNAKIRERDLAAKGLLNEEGLDRDFAEVKAAYRIAGPLEGVLRLREAAWHDEA